MKTLAAALAVGCMVAVAAGIAEGKEGGRMIAEGRTVSFNYTLAVDGEVIETTQGREPLTYVHGNGALIPGLEKQLEGMEEGQEKNITIAPDDAYGAINPKAFQEVPKENLPKDIPLEVGMQLQARTREGHTTLVTVSEVKPDTVILNFNHPLAGKTLQFQVKILTIQ